MSEKLPNVEIRSDRRKELIRGLREKGMESQEVLARLDAWVNERERMIEALGSSPDAKLGFEVDRAQIYAEGGYVNKALGMLRDALHVAEQENRPDLVDLIRKEIALLEATE